MSSIDGRTHAYANHAYLCLALPRVVCRHLRYTFEARTMGSGYGVAQVGKKQIASSD